MNMASSSIFLFVAVTILQVYGVYCGNEATETETNPRFLESINGSLYYITPDDVHITYYEALELCKSQNMKMVSLQSAEKENMIIDVVLARGYEMAYWTSGRRVSGDNFIWTGTGETIENYTNWDTDYNEPNNDGDCILIARHLYQWWDYACDYGLKGVICEEI